MLAHERAGRAGVIEVDVREQQVADVREREAALRQAPRQRLRRGGWTAVEEREAVGCLQQVRADDTLVPEVQEVERLARGDR
jgi:hypothetical protein